MYEITMPDFIEKYFMEDAESFLLILVSHIIPTGYDVSHVNILYTKLMPPLIILCQRAFSDFNAGIGRRRKAAR